MSRSDKQRRDNMCLAMRLMMQDLGEPYERQLHVTRTTKFADVHRTTWDELAEQNLVKAWTYDRYWLTGPGWIAGLKLTGRFKAPEFQQMVGKLSAALKARVKAINRDQWGGAGRAELARETGLTEFFIQDVIDSHLLREMGDIDASWGKGDSMKNYIDIPPRFGLEPLDVE
jgi:hypothetical protein